MDNEPENNDSGGNDEQHSDERDVDFSSLSYSDNDSENRGQEAENPEAGSALVVQLRSELQEANDKYLRALADLENYKKRAMKERSELLKYQGERVLADLLEVVDNLEFALQYTGSADSEANKAENQGNVSGQEGYEKLRQGVELIHKLFLNVLGKWEVRPESALGKVFDPQRFSAISKVVSPDAEPGTVISELKKAYLYKDKLLRPGEVVVAEAPPSEGPLAGDTNSESDP